MERSTGARRTGSGSARSGGASPAGIEALERVPVRSRAEWRAWLAEHHRESGSVWVVVWRKGRGPYVPYGELRDEALCFGWIDSRPGRLDERRSMLLMSRRRAGSGWSRVNKARVAALEAEGRMTAAGRRAIEAAKADGSWTALDAAHALDVPPDLAAALAAEAGAAERFAAFAPSSRRALLERIGQAKRPETRARRIRETATLAARGLRAGFPEARAAADAKGD